jgi:hypothetical protein
MRHIIIILSVLLLSIHAGAQNILPEVTVTDEIVLRTLTDDIVFVRADEFSKVEFKLYALKAEEAIATNDAEVASIKEILKNKRGKESIQHRRQVTWLEIENAELKNDFWNYLHYGEGNWNVFQLEFNQDLSLISEDLSKLKEAAAGY